MRRARPACVAIAALAALAAVACTRASSSEARLSRRALPGFSIELPDGTIKEQRLDYATGKLELRLDAGGGVAIEWNLGEPLTADELEQIAVTPLKQMLDLEARERREVEVPTATGPATQFVLVGRATSIEMRLTAWTCGRRWMSLLVAAPTSTAALDERIRRSFACTPDDAEEQRERRVPIMAGALGPDFGVAEDGDDMLIVESLDGAAAVFTRTTAELQRGDLGQQAVVAKMLEAMAGMAGITGLETGVAVRERRGGQERPVWRGRGAIDGDPVRVLFALIDCGEHRLTGLYLAPEAVPEERGLDVLVPVTCAAGDAPPSRPPPFAEVAAAACARGDRRGCAE